MKQITPSEMKAVLEIVKNPTVEYNANSLAKVIGITSMGTLKTLKCLEQEGILKSKKVGNARIYRLNVEQRYARQYVALLLSREPLHASSFVKRWVEEIKRLHHAEVIVLFGSVLHKDTPKDIDVLLLVDKKNFSILEKEVSELNRINVKKIHPMYQTWSDLLANIQKRDKPLLNALKGMVVAGEEKFIELYNESRKE